MLHLQSRQLNKTEIAPWLGLIGEMQDARLSVHVTRLIVAQLSRCTQLSLTINETSDTNIGQGGVHGWTSLVKSAALGWGTCRMRLDIVDYCT